MPRKHTSLKADIVLADLPQSFQDELHERMLSSQNYWFARGLDCSYEEECRLEMPELVIARLEAGDTEYEVVGKHCAGRGGWDNFRYTWADLCREIQKLPTPAK